MKWNFLFTLCLASLLSHQNIYAMEIHGGKLISDTSWSEENIQGSFKDNKIEQKKNSFSLFAASHKALRDIPNTNEGIFAVNHLIDQNGTVGTPTEIIGGSEVYIENFTGISQTYYISKSICYFQLVQPCAKNQVIVQLDPNGYLQMDTRSTASTVFQDPGKYAALFFTTITRDQSPTSFSTYARGLVTIS